MVLPRLMVRVLTSPRTTSGSSRTRWYAVSAKLAPTSWPSGVRNSTTSKARIGASSSHQPLRRRRGAASAEAGAPRPRGRGRGRSRVALLMSAGLPELELLLGLLQVLRPPLVVADQDLVREPGAGGKRVGDFLRQLGQ